MKQILSIVLVAAGLLMTSARTNAQMKIAFVNTQELYSILPEAKKADSSLKAFQEVLQRTGEDYQQEFQDKLTKFNGDSAKLTGPQKEVERKKLQDLYTRVANYQQEAQQQLQAKQQELVIPLQKSITNLVSQVAKENGYTHVFEREALIVVPEGDNLLPLIKRKMNLK